MKKMDDQATHQIQPSISMTQRKLHIGSFVRCMWFNDNDNDEDMIQCEVPCIVIDKLGDDYIHVARLEASTSDACHGVILSNEITEPDMEKNMLPLLGNISPILHILFPTFNGKTLFVNYGNLTTIPIFAEIEVIEHQELNMEFMTQMIWPCLTSSMDLSHHWKQQLMYFNNEREKDSILWPSILPRPRDDEQAKTWSSQEIFQKQDIWPIFTSGGETFWSSDDFFIHKKQNFTKIFQQVIVIRRFAIPRKVKSTFQPKIKQETKQDKDQTPLTESQWLASRGTWKIIPKTKSKICLGVYSRYYDRMSGEMIWGFQCPHG
jgi:hypothetical protein